MGISNKMKMITKTSKRQKCSKIQGDNNKQTVCVDHANNKIVLILQETGLTSWSSQPQAKLLIVTSKPIMSK